MTKRYALVATIALCASFLGGCASHSEPAAGDPLKSKSNQFCKGIGEKCDSDQECCGNPPRCIRDDGCGGKCCWG
jgi:hypothetical protein